MNTTQLECFVTLANTHNYVRTGEELGLTQPAVSRQIQALEEELGARLFDRTTRSVALSEAGTQFLHDAQSLLHIYYHAKDRIADRNARQRIRIGYSDPHAAPFIGQVLYRMGIRHRSLHPAFTLDQTDANLRRLQEGQLEVVTGMKDATFSAAGVRFTPLHEDRFVCLVRADDPLASLPSGIVATKDFRERPQIISIPPYLLKNYFARGRTIIPVNDEMDNLVCGNVNESYTLVLAGYGFALVPEHLVMPHPDLRTLRWKESPHAPFGVYHAETPLPVVQDFIATAKELKAEK